MLSFPRRKFEDFLALAKAAFIAEEEAKITIRMIAESKDDGEWRQVVQKRKRSLTSIVTEVGVKEQLERDIIEFCRSEEWYAFRGLPWRRRFLLHGAPLFCPSTCSLSDMILAVRCSRHRKDVLGTCSGFRLRP